MFVGPRIKPKSIWNMVPGRNASLVVVGAADFFVSFAASQNGQQKDEE